MSHEEAAWKPKPLSEVNNVLDGIVTVRCECVVM